MELTDWTRLIHEGLNAQGVESTISLSSGRVDVTVRAGGREYSYSVPEPPDTVRDEALASQIVSDVLRGVGK